MIRLSLIISLFSAGTLISLSSCKSESNAPKFSLEGRWNEVGRTWFVYDGQGKLLSQTSVPIPQEKPYLIITSNKIEEHLNERVSVFPSYTYTRQQNTLTYADGTKIQIVELSAEKLTLLSPGPVAAAPPGTSPGRMMIETNYSR